MTRTVTSHKLEKIVKRGQFQIPRLGGWFSFHM